MSGSNGIVKYAQVNREDELKNLKWRGTEYNQYPQIAVTNALLTPEQMLSDIYLDATSPNALTASSTNLTIEALAASYLTEPDSGWKILVSNDDPVNAKTITFPAGWTPTTITIPPGANTLLSWRVVSQNPPVIELVGQLNSTSSFISTATAVIHDILTFDGTQYIPTNAAASTLYSDVKGIQSVNGLVGQTSNRFTSTTSNVLSTVNVSRDPPAGEPDTSAVRLQGLAGTWGTRAATDSLIYLQNLQGADPAAGAAGPAFGSVNTGAYYIVAESQAPATGFNFTVDRQGRIRCSCRIQAGGNNVTRDPVSGEIIRDASTNDQKTNIQVFDPDFIEALPNATSWEAISNNLGRKFASEMVDDIKNNNGLTADQKKMLLEYPYLSPEDPSAPYYDPSTMCNKFLFPEGKFDFDNPTGINNNSFIDIVKAYAIKHVTDLDTRVSSIEESGVDTAQQNQINTLSASVSANSSAISTLQSSLVSTQNSVNELIDDVNAVETSVSSQQSSISSLTSTVASLQSQVVSLQTALTALTATVNSLIP